ncbi:MAG: hypothetical protein RL033_4253 [Pseudomonadota bacterium]
MSRIKGLLSISVLILASVLGCKAAAQHPGEGRLDLVIRPDNAVASSRPVQGRFLVRSLEHERLERIEVHSPYETLSLPLREGGYTLEWQPDLALRFSDDPAVWASELSSVPVAQSLSIQAGRVTTVQVRAAVDGGISQQRLALSEELPSVQILVARH